MSYFKITLLGYVELGVTEFGLKFLSPMTVSHVRLLFRLVTSLFPMMAFDRLQWDVI